VEEALILVISLDYEAIQLKIHIKKSEIKQMNKILNNRDFKATGPLASILNFYSFLKI
jgi:hypothetical protein